MKKSFRSLVLKLSILQILFIGFAVNQAVAQDSAVSSVTKSGFTFAYVDINELISKSEAAKSIDDQMKALRDKFMSEAKAKEAKFKARDESLKKQQKALAADKFAEQVKAFQKDIASAQTIAFNRNKQLNNAYMRAMLVIKRKTTEATEKVAQRKFLDLVLPRSEVIYASTATDITADVLKELNATLPKLQIEVK